MRVRLALAAIIVSTVAAGVQREADAYSLAFASDIFECPIDIQLVTEFSNMLDIYGEYRFFAVLCG